MPRLERTAADILRRAVLFRTLAPASAARLAVGAAVSKSRRGTRLYGSGERCAGVYTVITGRVMLSVGAAKNASKTIELIGPGGHFGLAAAVLGAPQIAAAETLVDSTLLLIPRRDLIDGAAADAGLALLLATALSREVCGLTADIAAVSLHSGRERVASYLLQLAGAAGAPQRPVELPTKKGIIASRLGLTPEYFSRMLHELTAAGAIAVDGRQITVLDPARLRQHGV